MKAPIFWFLATLGVLLSAAYFSGWLVIPWPRVAKESRALDGNTYTLPPTGGLAGQFSLIINSNGHIGWRFPGDINGLVVVYPNGYYTNSVRTNSFGEPIIYSQWIPTK